MFDSDDPQQHSHSFGVAHIEIIYDGLIIATRVVSANHSFVVASMTIYTPLN